MEYTRDLKRKVQLNELNILLKFDSICKKNSIHYQLFAGTLLGAVRHKGFIPWDDDIDVCMPREEYDKFINCCTNEELGNDYFLQTNQTDKESVIQFAKLRLNGTILEMNNETSIRSHKGIWIDIFPLDNVEPGTKKCRKQYKKINFWYSFVTSSAFSRIKTAHSFLTKFARFLAFLFVKIAGKRNIDKKLDRLFRLFNSKKTEYLNHLTNGVLGSRTTQYLCKRSFVEESIELEFEGHFFPCPKDYDKYLTQIYGNYMELPPENKRVSEHSIVNIKFKDIN
jgi:lipopolysaccharide cholinephosphotransferase